MNYHDALAKLGVGIAHPGGFAATKQWIQKIPWNSIKDVAEIGCGTGRTACHLASLYNIQITGYDTRQLMIEKAKVRAKKHSLNHKVKFSIADAHKIPMETGSVDLVYLESLAVFVQPEILFAEIYRILRPGGKIIDVEMAKLPSMPKNVLEDIKRFYEVRQVPTLQGWKQLLKLAGFEHVKSILTADVDPKHVSEFPEEFDQDQIISVLPAEMLEIQQILQTNAELLAKTAPFLQYTVLTGVKKITE